MFGAMCSVALAFPLRYGVHTCIVHVHYDIMLSIIHLCIFCRLLGFTFRYMFFWSIPPTSKIVSIR